MTVRYVCCIMYTVGVYLRISSNSDSCVCTRSLKSSLNAGCESSVTPIGPLDALLVTLVTSAIDAGSAESQILVRASTGKVEPTYSVHW